LLTQHGAGGAQGLALDESLMGNYARGTDDSPPTLRLYTYKDHSALCGRYQNLPAEINIEACERTGTEYNRRPTGGGAIVMGAGQLGIAVVTRAPVSEHPKLLLERFSAGIITGLAKLGVDAAFAGKNDLKVDGRKIAGLGLYLDGAAGLLFHSSVLADLDIGFMLEVLDTPASKLGSAGIDAVKERVTTVSRETAESWNGTSLSDVIGLGFCDALGIDLDESRITAEEQSRAGVLVETKFSTDEWRLQRSPRSDTTGSAVLRTPAGHIRLYLSMNGDTIKSALFTGDFNALPASLAAFESSLKWTRADRGQLARVAAETCGTDTGLGVPVDDLVSTVLEAAEQVATRTIAAPDIEGSCYFPETEGPQQ
ncbi:MAG: biotin/lipoate A/B protein ligase family protein, partial [Acidimicrobiales bacterium]